MAKKKVKKSELGKLTAFVSVILGIVAAVMIFLPAIAIKDSDVTYTGLQAAFGYSEETILGNFTYFEFSFMNLLTYILAIVGVVFTVLGVLGKGGNFATFIAAAAFIVSGVFFFLSVSFSVPNSLIERSLVLGVGSVIGGIAALLAGIVSLAKVILK